MDHKLTLDYDEHPAFAFNQAAWSGDAGQQQVFEEAYSALETLAHSLTSPSWSRVARRCESELTAYFTALASEADSPLEKAFLMELLEECGKVLRSELEHFRAPPGARFADLRTEQATENAVRLQQRRYFISRLPAQVAEELKAIGGAELEGFRANAAKGKVERSDLSINTGPTVKRIRSILNAAFREAGVLDAVGAYMLREMEVVGLALELSVPQATWWANALGSPSPATLYAHVDEERAAPKSIVYLSDVSEASGPTSCYPGLYQALDLGPLQELIGRAVGNVGNLSGSDLNHHYAKTYHQSMSSAGFRRHFMRLPPACRFNSHLGWDVLAGSALESRMLASEVPMIGPPGTFIAFDGARLFHRGGMVAQGERVALQVVFGRPTAASRLRQLVKST